MPIVVSDPRPGVRLLRLNRPEALNALNGALWLALGKELSNAETDAAVRCVVLAGNDRAFSAGADLKEMRQGALPPYVAPERIASRRILEAFVKPLIAAVNGYALGGGCELMLNCDLVVAGRNAKIGTPEVKVGNFPAAGGTHLLPRFVGKARALHMILTGEILDAQKALEWGLINWITDTGKTVETALEMAERIAGYSPLATQLTKADLLESIVDRQAVGNALEKKMLLWQSDDRVQAVKGFSERKA